MAAERVDLDKLPGRVRLRAWAHGDPLGWRYREIGYGTYGTYGWYAHRVGQRGSGAWIVPDERAACELVQRWMGDGQGWRPQPARSRPPIRPSRRGR